MAESKDEIRVRRLSPELKAEAVNISKNLGVGLNSLLKPIIAQFVNSYPPEMRKPKKD
jgi:hypothetical protein